VRNLGNCYCAVSRFPEPALDSSNGTLKEKQALEEALHALSERRELMYLATPARVTNNNESLEPHTR
jgi:hypothetical protein